MAVMGLLFPVVLHATGTELQMGKSELVLSRFSSIVMLVAYIAYLYFQLKSHKELYDSEEVRVVLPFKLYSELSLHRLLEVYSFVYLFIFFCFKASICLFI